MTLPAGENPFNSIVDPSVVALPSWVKDAYEDRNAQTARDRATYGETIQYEHLTMSRSAIAATAAAALRHANGDEDRTALILGPGGCFDIPLEEIVTAFDKTTLVDVDTTQTERALSELPARLLGKIGLVRADITGRVAEMSAIFEQTDGMDYLGFIAAATAAVNSMIERPSYPPVQGRHSFTCSQLLLTQLSSIPFLRFARHVGDVYGQPLSLRPGLPDEPLGYALNEYNVKIQADHIRHLAQLTRPNGTIHFADTIAEVVHGQVMPMMNAVAIEEMATQLSPLTPEVIWTWRSTPDRQFYVLGQSFTPKHVDQD